LLTVDDVLGEDAELVAYAISQGGHLQCGQGVQEAGGQSAQTTVAQTRFLLLPKQFFEAQTQVAHGQAHVLVNAQVDQIVAQVGAEQEFGGEVGHGPRAQSRVGLRRADPVVQHAIPHRIGQGHVVVVFRRQGGELALHMQQVVQEGALDRFLPNSDGLIRRLVRGKVRRDVGIHSGLPGAGHRGGGLDSTARKMPHAYRRRLELFTGFGAQKLAVQHQVGAVGD
jgi:hypothetical protein